MPLKLWFHIPNRLAKKLFRSCKNQYHDISSLEDQFTVDRHLSHHDEDERNGLKTSGTEYTQLKPTPVLRQRSGSSFILILIIVIVVIK